MKGEDGYKDGGASVSKQEALHAMELRARYLVLLLLAEGPKTGYEILKALRSLIPELGRSASPGTIYPLLRRLEEEGCVEAYEEPSGRRRRIYRLTSKGVETLLAMVLRGLGVIEVLLRLHLRAAERLASGQSRLRVDPGLLTEIASRLAAIEELTRRLREKLDEAREMLEAQPVMRGSSAEA